MGTHGDDDGDEVLEWVPLRGDTFGESLARSWDAWAMEYQGQPPAGPSHSFLVWLWYHLRDEEGKARWRVLQVARALGARHGFEASGACREAERLEQLSDDQIERLYPGYLEISRWGAEMLFARTGVPKRWLR